jgi:hypothetical protein
MCAASVSNAGASDGRRMIRGLRAAVLTPAQRM